MKTTGKITGIEKLPFTVGKPALARLRLALRAVAITAGVKRDGLMAAASAAIDVAAQSGCTATGAGPHHFELLIADPGFVSVDEAVASGAEDVGHLKGGPAHYGWILKERFIVSGAAIAMLSTGLDTACRCRCDRCR